MPTSPSMQKLKEEDPDRYREMVREQKRRYRQAHPDKVRQQKKRDSESRKNRGLPSNNTSSEAYKNRRKKNVLNRATKIRLFFNKFKASQKCRFCDESESVCIDFHHLKDKNDGISSIISCKSITYSKIISELNKCIPACANCHRKIHAGILDDSKEIAISLTKESFKM